MLLCLLSIDNSLYKVVKDKIIVDEFKDEQNKEIAKIVFKRFEEKKGIVPAELINLAGEETSGVFARLIQGECNFDDNIKAVMDIIKKMELYRLEDRQKRDTPTAFFRKFVNGRFGKAEVGVKGSIIENEKYIE